jgi:tetratricopeptide (TPR) repeat protein
MASQGETLREKASRLMNEYEALGARPGGESAYAEAMTIYQQLLGEHPDDARLHLEYGYLQECNGRNLIRAAAGCYERAIELDPGWDKPHDQLIFARSALHESERVIELYKQRLAAAPDQIREYRFLAGAYLRSGALDEASRVIAAGRKLEPDDDMLLAAEAELLDASGRREEALAAWRTLKQRDPDDLSPYFMSAFTLEALGRYQEAAADGATSSAGWKNTTTPCTPPGRRRCSKGSKPNSPPPRVAATDRLHAAYLRQGVAAIYQRTGAAMPAHRGNPRRYGPYPDATYADPPTAQRRDRLPNLGGFVPLRRSKRNRTGGYVRYRGRPRSVDSWRGAS